ncbi:hypothetical protein LTR36_010938 [Oleoguttula mirabilis]|uniref:Uncharacterized protein n=1 Tax=Oleoguttula mirabilis TaxID=1507867 RepID=A0AAV9J490_9PEZI|nr:hypothetical protein LTR36_010938 [Oleoguttula mirabilis]
MDSDEIRVASSSTPPPPARSPFPNAKQEIHKPPVAPPPASTIRKKFKIPKGQAFSTPASFLDPDRDLRDDLKDLGFSAKRVKELVAKPEPVVDGHAQIPQYVGKVTEEEEREKEEAASRSERLQRGGKGRYEHLYLAEGTNWVLFDPLRGYPRHASEPSETLQKFETFKPGNAKILEYNTVSQSVRVRSAPKVLLGEGRDVQYLATGPRLVEVAKLKGERGGGGRAGKAKRKEVVVVADSSEGEGSELDGDEEFDGGRNVA